MSKKGLRFKRRVLLIFSAFGFLGLAGTGAGFLFLTWNLPSVSKLRTYRPAVASEVFSEDFVKIGEFYRDRRIFVPLHEVPPIMIQGMIAAEDSDFFKHKGLSWHGIVRAMFRNVAAGGVKQGGSTITQQVAKGMLLSPERSIARKVREALLAYRMEKIFSKEEILEIYLNQVYLGNGSYGVQAAAQTYFNKDVVDITLGEASMLAGLTKAPSRDNPYRYFDRAKDRQKYVLKRMLEEKYISKDEYSAAIDAPIKIVQQSNVNLRYSPYFVEHVRRYLTDKYGDEQVLDSGLQVYTTLRASDAISANRSLREGLEELDRHQGYRGPLQNVPKVEREAFLKKLTEDQPKDLILEPGVSYRGLVTSLQEAVTYVSLGERIGLIPIETMRWARKPNADKDWGSDLIDKPSEALSEGDVVLVRAAPADLSLKAPPPKKALLLTLAQEPIVQGALVAIDPQSGAVRAMVGGYDFSKSEFNRAVQARRQPGSSFKPIIYAAALDNGFTASSMLLDTPIVYDNPTTDSQWKPKNYGGKFHGDTIFRDCLIESRNIPTVKIVEQIGVEAVMKYASRFGITSPLARDFSLALGSSAVVPMELVTAYTVFASGGKRATPVFIRRVVDRDGKILEDNFPGDAAAPLIGQASARYSRTLANQVAAEASAARTAEGAALPEGYALSPQTSYLMTHLLKQVIRVGTGTRARAINRPAAGKTGTTNDNFDAWFIGYTPALVAGVWLGFDEAQSLGSQEVGGSAASPIWLSFMLDALKDAPPEDFPVPEGITFAQIDTKSGKLASAGTKGPVFEAFLEGTEPKETDEQSRDQKTTQQFFMNE